MSIMYSFEFKIIFCCKSMSTINNQLPQSLNPEKSFTLAKKKKNQTLEELLREKKPHFDSINYLIETCSLDIQEA